MATLYVDDATGDDSRSKATAANPATPWATLGRAAWGNASRTSPNSGEAAAAGDTVVIAAGTYDSTATGGDRFDCLYNPTNAGSVGNPITFRAVGLVELTSTTWGGPLIGSDARDYITWEGHFFLDEIEIETAPDTGPVVLHDCEGSIINGIEIDGGTVGPWDDNHTGVRLEAVVGCTVKNCTIYNVFEVDPGHNGAAIMTYDAVDCIIEHNWCHDCGSGIFLKGAATAQSGNIVRFNLVEDCEEGIIAHVATGSRVYQNIVDGCTHALLLFQLNSSEGPDGSWMFNNLAINSTLVGMYWRGDADNLTSVRSYNNIIVDNGYGSFADANGLPAGCAAEHNVYFSNTDFFGSSSGDESFATYKANYGQSAASPASIDGSDPLFVNQAGGDYHLQGGSPALTIGSAIGGVGGPDGTIIPAGPYITGDEVIGPEDEPAITLVQSAEDLTSPFITDGTGVATFAAPTTLGNVIIVVAGVNANVTFTFADNGSGGTNTYGSTTLSTFVSTAGVCQIAYAVVERAATIVTVTASAASAGSGAVKIMEFSGLDIADLLEDQAQDNRAVANTSHPTGPVTTLIDKGLLIGVLQGSLGAYDGTPTGFTEVYDQTFGVAAYKILSAPTTAESWTPTSAAGELSTSSLVAFNGLGDTPPPPSGSVPVVIANLRNQGIL